MKISKRDALTWFEFFVEIDGCGPLSPRQTEIAYATLAQIEAAAEARFAALAAEIPGLKSLGGRSLYVGDDSHFPQGCRSCLLGTGLSAIRRNVRVFRKFRNGCAEHFRNDVFFCEDSFCARIFIEIGRAHV